MPENSLSSNEQLERIKYGAQILFKPKQLVEVRVRLKSDYWRGFYFDNHERMAETVLTLDAHPQIQSIYYVFNHINPKLIEQRAKCTCDKCARGGLILSNPNAAHIETIINGPSQHLTANEDVENLNWLFIDVDTLRAAEMEHESSTAKEKAGGKEVAKKVVAYLKEKEWPTMALADSGNGFHILAHINLPNSQNSIGLLVDCLSALASKFNNNEAKIDDAVFNAARLTRAYGTTTRKGTNTEARPYRFNKIFKVTGSIGLVNQDKIIELGDESIKAYKVRGDMPLLHPEFDPQKFFDWYEEQGAFHITASNSWQGHEIKVTDHCITAEHKHTGSGLTGFIIGGTFGYHCFSDDCTGVTIGDVLQKLNEEYKPFKSPIWAEEDISNFAEDQSQLEADMSKEKLKFEKELEVKKDEPEAKENDPVIHEATHGIGENACPVPTPSMKFCPACGCDLGKPYSERLVGKEPNELAERMINIIFRDPVTVYTDFILFKARFLKHVKYFKSPVSDTFKALLDYEEEIRHLPNKMELKDYVNNHPSSRDINKKIINNYIDTLQEDTSHTFDVTALALLEEIDWRLDKKALLRAHDVLERTRDIAASRTILRKHWAASMALDTDFRPGTWQENTDTILEAFRRDVAGEANERKFITGFDSIDNSGMNIGLDGMHAVVLYGPANNRKTTTALTMALNFAMRGKHGLFLAGEHARIKIEKSLTLMFSHYLRRDDNNPDGLDVIPGLNKWEGLNNSVTWGDFENIQQVLLELKTMRMVPGYLEVQNIDALARGEKDILSAITSYADATYKKYQWDFIIIDPLDSILPNEGEDKNHYQACCSIVDRLFSYSRTFAGDRGIMLMVTAQFKAEARRAIEKIQQKNAGPDRYDDELESLLRQDSQIQYIGNKLTQRFDLGIGVACRVKNGTEGMLVQGRSREGGFFDVLGFRADPDSNIIVEDTGLVTKSITSAAAASQGYGEATIPHNYDEQL